MMIVGNTSSDGPKYFVCIEREIINSEGFGDFFTALRTCYGAYYVFNMKYPQKCSSIEFIQRYLLKTHPDKGSKGNTCSK